ncbi:MAG: DUF4345 family protein [Myxococcota bacterium]|jgi:hypothetical protein|nr:DUF4345 family protein [Myxococcota bacterium]
MWLRVILGIFGVMFLFNAVNFLLSPVDAAIGLGMELLDDMGRSSQVGDIGGFFLGSGAMLLLGAYQKNSAWLRAAAVMVGAVAVMRILAWGIQDATFATVFIGIEILIAGVALYAASSFDAEA